MYKALVLCIIMQPAQCTHLNQKVLNEVSLGLEFLKMFALPQEHMISVKQLQSIAAEGPNGRVRTIVEIQ